MEAALKAYVADKSPQNMAVFMQALHTARFLVPVEFPKQMQKEVVEKLRKGEKLTPQEMPRMLPILMRNSKDEHFAPAFTSKEQLPENHNYVAIMPVTFAEVLRIAQVKEYKVKGILLNPESDKLILGSKMIAMMDKVSKGAEIAAVLEEEGYGKVQKQKISMTVEQFHGFARRNVELGLLPKMAFQNKEKFVETIDTQKETMLLELYKGMYRANVAFPYEAGDFDVMALEIRDDLTIISLGFPAKNMMAGACSSAYVAWNPKTEEIRYYAVEKGKESTNLVQIHPDGKYNVLEEAPAPGSEMYRIIEMLDEA